MSRAKDLVTLRDSTTVRSAAKALHAARKHLKVIVHAGPIETLRVAQHSGRKIEIRTTYDIRIGGRRVRGHMELGNDGHVHYHGLPAYGWGSAVDMCKQLIDSFPQDYPRKGKTPRREVKLKGSTSRKKRATKKKPARKKASKKKPAKKKAAIKKPARKRVGRTAKKSRRS